MLGLASLACAFHVIHAVLLRPLPYAEPDQLLRIFEHNVREGVVDGRLSSADYVDYREANETLVSIAAFANSAVPMPTDDGGVLLNTELVTPDFFATLGIAPLHGSWFTDQHYEGQRRFVLLSYDLWRTAFGGDTSIIGSSIPLGEGGEPREIVGVMPASFRGVGGRPDVWLPWGRIENTGSELSPLWRRMHPLSVIARRRADLSLNDVQQNLLAIAQRLETLYPEENTGHLVRVRTLHDSLTGNVAAGLWALFGAVALVMLAAVVNLAHVFVARNIERSREFAVRLALGAGRWRLALQMGTETAVIAIPAALISVPAGHLLATWLVAGDAQLVPRSVDAAPSAWLFVLVAVLGLCITGTMALIPVVRRRSIMDTSLGQCGVARFGRAAGRLRNALAAGQVGIALVLLVGAVVTARSYRAITDVDPGFDANGVGTAEIVIPFSRYPNSTDRRELIFRLQDAVAQLPGMTNVGVTSTLPLSTGGGVAVYGRNIAEIGRQAHIMNVDAGSFEVLRIPVISGRTFSPSDGPDEPRVGLVNEAFVRTFFPNATPIGETVRWGDPDAAPIELVGVVGDVKQNGPVAPAPPILYINAEQSSWLSFFLVGRTAINAQEQLPLIRQAIQRVDAELVPWQLTTLEDAVAETFARQRMSRAVLAVLALVTVTVSIVGVYGVFSHQLAARHREISLRIALGATAHRVRSSVVRDALRAAGTGVVVGLGVAGLLARSAGSLIHGIPALDVWSFTVAPIVLLSLAALAAWIPANRSSRADPAVVLRSD